MPARNQRLVPGVAGARKAAGPLAGEVRDALRDRIVSGELAPLARIRETQIASELGVSRTPLREALFQLACEGLIRCEPERGFRVEPIDPREVREAYPMIWTLEALAVRSAGPILQTAIGELEHLNRALASAPDPEAALELDAQWHDALVASCNNQRLRATLRGLRLAVRRYENVYMSDTVLLGQSVKQHSAIAGALRAGQLELAIQELEANWHDGMRVLLSKLGEPWPPDPTAG
jgi:DNA-binding GntR family transcriptional regulator